MFIRIAMQYKGEIVKNGALCSDDLKDVSLIQMGRRPSCTNAITFTENNCNYFVADIEEIDETEEDHQATAGRYHSEAGTRCFTVCYTKNLSKETPEFVLRKSKMVFDEDFASKVSHFAGPKIFQSSTAEDIPWIIHSRNFDIDTIMKFLGDLSDSTLRDLDYYWIEIKNGKFVIGAENTLPEEKIVKIIETQLQMMHTMK